MKKKVCKACKMFIEGNECPVHGAIQTSTNWQGRLNILNNKDSIIAKKINIEHDGEYAIKVR